MKKISLYDERKDANLETMSMRYNDIVVDLFNAIEGKDWILVKRAFNNLIGEGCFDEENSKIYTGEVKYAFPNEEIHGVAVEELKNKTGKYEEA